jgi:hypothetical protein
MWGTAGGCSRTEGPGEVTEAGGINLKMPNK